MTPGAAQYKYVADKKAKYGIMVAPWEQVPRVMQIEFEESARAAIAASDLGQLAKEYFEAKDGCENCQPDNECYFDCMKTISDAEDALRAAIEIKQPVPKPPVSL